MTEISSKLKILVVSSDKESSFAIKTQFKKIGLLDVTIIDSGIDALKSAEATTYELILCDLEARFLSGWLFVQEFKNSTKLKNVAMILFGRDDCPVSEVKLAQYGIPGFLKFPFDNKAMMPLVARALHEIKTRGSTENLYTEAKEKVLAEKHNEAMTIYEGLHRSTQQSVRSTVGLIHTLEKTDNKERAQNLAIDLVARGGDDLSALMTALRIAFDRKNGADIKQFVDKILELSAETPLYYLSCLELALKYERIEVAEKIVNSAFKKKFEMNEFYIAQAKLKFAQNLAEEALEIIKTACKKFKESLEGLNLEGVCLRKLGRFKEAMAAYEKALLLSPMDVKIYFNMGLVSVAAKDYHVALHHLDTCLKMAPDAVKIRKKRDEILAEMQKLQEAS